MADNHPTSATPADPAHIVSTPPLGACDSQELLPSYTPTGVVSQGCVHNLRYVGDNGNVLGSDDLTRLPLAKRIPCAASQKIHYDVGCQFGHKKGT